MKRLIAVVTALLFIMSACGKSNPKPTASDEITPSPDNREPYEFTVDNYPVIYGPAAVQLLSEALAAGLLGIPRAAAAPYAHLTQSTQEAYDALIGGECDLILAYMPDDVTQAAAASAGVTLEKTAVAKDALVFINDTGNSVNGLFHEQLLSIYSGQILNWQTLGGADRNIRAFQRGRSGSRTLFNRMMELDGALIDPILEYLPDGDGGVKAAVANYNYSPSALGYTTYTAVSLLQPAALKRCKLLSVDGVMPDKRSIVEGTYRYVTDIYAVIRADEPDDSPARILAEWLSTPEGQAVVEREGYGWIVASPAERLRMPENRK